MSIFDNPLFPTIPTLKIEEILGSNIAFFELSWMSEILCIFIGGLCVSTYLLPAPCYLLWVFGLHLARSKEVHARFWASIEVDPSSLLFLTEVSLRYENLDINVGEADLLISDMKLVGDPVFSDQPFWTQSLAPEQEMKSPLPILPILRWGAPDRFLFLAMTGCFWCRGILEGTVDQPLLVVEPYPRYRTHQTELVDDFLLKSVGDAPVTLTSIDHRAAPFYGPGLSLPHPFSWEERTVSFSFLSSG